MSVKGISPLIATVLLIAFGVVIAAVLNVWMTGFTKKTSERVEEEAMQQLTCSQGGISLRDLVYNSTTSYLSGKIENTGSITLGEISLQILYTNFTTQKTDLCLSDSTTVVCSLANLTLTPRELASFNISVSSNYDVIRVNNNCTKYGVYDEASRSEVL